MVYRSLQTSLLDVPLLWQEQCAKISETVEGNGPTGTKGREFFVYEHNRRSNWSRPNFRWVKLTLNVSSPLFKTTNKNHSDYDETAYDNYFEERQEKIDEGEIIISSNDDLDDALSAFEAIDWGIFGDYDYYYNY